MNLQLSNSEAVVIAPQRMRAPHATVMRFTPNADFQKWFRPVFQRLLIGLAVSPFVVIILGITGTLTAVLDLSLNYLRLFKMFLLAPTLPQIGGLLMMLSYLALPFFVLMGLVVAYCTIRFLNAADILYVGEKGIVVGKVSYKDGQNIVFNVLDEVSWHDVTEVKIVRPPLTRSNHDYYFSLQRNQKPIFKLRYGDILLEEDRQKVVKIMQNRFGSKFNSDAFNVFAPPAERQSYTELWLSELTAAPKRDRLTPLEVGATVNNQKYQVASKLGVGGQGTVYLALTTALKVDGQPEEVVLKEFVLPIYPDKSVRKAAALRFQKEADLLTKIDHPHVVKLKDLFIEDHRAYLVLEHMTGRNLKDLIAEQGPLPNTEIYRLAKQMAEILVYLHGQSPPVVHRDFTPDNLILDEDGKIKLIDFSVAQSFTSNVTGSVVGKPHYIAPEQFRGKPTSQSDIYSMGATLFYLATGKDPEPISTIRLREYTSQADGNLDTIIEKATKMDVTLRYHEAGEILEQLENYVS